MKKFFLFLFMAVTSFAFATIRTVSNSPATLAQFNTIQAAITASFDGDTVFVHGSPNQYAGFSLVNKRLTIIGPGWAPNKNLAFTAVVQQSNIQGAGSNNSEIQGLVFVGSMDCNSNHADNLRFIRNQFAGVRVHVHQGSVTYSGYLFEGNYFDNAQVYAETNSTYTNFIFQNNWFTETGCCFVGNLRGFVNTTGVLFNHNLWSSSGSGNRTLAESSCRFLSFTNNIFVRRHPSTNISNSTFTNNLTFTCGDNTPWASNGNVDAGGNLPNVDPQMTTTVANGVPGATNDFTINAGPANNAGSDGKDLGLLYDVTGSLNWANSRNSRLPLIFSMNIANPTISSGGTLNVTVEARKSN